MPFISHIFLPRTIGKAFIALDYPRHDNDSHVINVICGPNNSGKSYVLREIRKIISGWNDKYISEQPSVLGQELKIQFDEPSSVPPKIACLTGTWSYKKKAGLIALERKVGKYSSDTPRHEECFLSFIAKHLGLYLKNTELPADFWPHDPAFRMKAVESLKEKTLYITSREDSTIRLLETVLGGRLYFWKSGAVKKPHYHLELVLVYGNGNAIPYSNWSDGQQAFCYLTVLVGEERPDILLLDELENHLHPVYMTQVLEMIREIVPQSIVATHHPHIIFSELVDNITYIDTDRYSQPSNPEVNLPYKEAARQQSPNRRLLSVNDTFEKIAVSYKLFDHHDKQLLKQAGLIARDADILFYSALTACFNSKVAPETTRSTPDTQAKLLGDHISNILTIAPDVKSDLTLFDFGSGIGRLPLEFFKDSRFRLQNQINWVCWEPDETRRKKIKDKFRDNPLIQIPEDLGTIKKESAVCVMANLLHELTPPHFADALINGLTRIRNTSDLVILELFPLLHPEKFAVPYPPDVLQDLLCELGFSGASTVHKVHGIDCYILSARLESALPERQKIIRHIEKTWDKLQKRAIRQYKGVFRQHIWHS